MRLFVCDPVERQARILLGVGMGCERIAVAEDVAVTRRALEKVLEGGDGQATVAFVHAQGVGRACSATEDWFRALPGGGLGIVYSEAWDDTVPAVVELAPLRWRVGTTQLLANVRPFVQFLASVGDLGGLTADTLLAGSWEPVLRERVLVLLGLLLPGTVSEEWEPSSERLEECLGAVQDLVWAVRAAVDSGRHPGWIAAGPVLQPLASEGSADDQVEALAEVVQQCLPEEGSTRHHRCQGFLDLRSALLPLLEPQRGTT